MWRTFLTDQRELSGGIKQLTDKLERIIADPGDKMIPIATARTLADRLSSARLVLFDQGGHQLPRHIPQTIAAHIAEFSRSLR
jgi:pimeloyl-ACP methyl ester carboxylesterase